MEKEDKLGIEAAEKYIKVNSGEIPRTVLYSYEKTYNYIQANWRKYDEVQSGTPIK